MVHLKTLFRRPKTPDPSSEPSAAPKIKLHCPAGHFYSPIVDPASLERYRDFLWPAEVSVPHGIDFNDAYHVHVLETAFPAYYPEFDYPEHGPGDDEVDGFYIRNSQFSWLDARSAFVLLRYWKPSRIIEVGSGFSTLLMADVIKRFLHEDTELSAVEPYPRSFLKTMQIDLQETFVQDVPFEYFERLEAGDVLFIDSSHVSKTGSDVNYLLFHVLPRLKSGVKVHIHDIFLPAEYKQDWVLSENRSWNEQYVVQALLMYSTRFRVLFGSNHAYIAHKDKLAAALGVPTDRLYGGGSLWLEVA